MLVVWPVEGHANALGQLLGAEQPVDLHHPAFAVHPLGLYRVELRALSEQQTAYNPHPPTALLDLSVMRADSGTHLLAYVPGSVVPNQNQNLLADPLELLAAPLQEAGGYGAHRTAIHEAQPCPFRPRQEEPVTGESLGVWIIFDDRLLHQTRGLPLLASAVQRGQSQQAPPGFVLETHHPARVPLRQADQPVSAPFFSRTRGRER